MARKFSLLKLKMIAFIASVVYNVLRMIAYSTNVVYIIIDIVTYLTNVVYYASTKKMVANIANLVYNKVLSS
jgi:hypothetical protein